MKMFECSYCGWIDQDINFFHSFAGKIYCSLHGVSGKSTVVEDVMLIVVPKEVE